jgi:hypothetical protein
MRAPRFAAAVFAAAVLAAAAGARGRALEPRSLASASPTSVDRSVTPAQRDELETRLREAVGDYGFLCAGGVQLAVLVAFVLGRGGRRRAR